MTDKQLTGKQRLFVIYYVATLNGTKAARLAGYNGDDNTLAVVAYENLRKPHIKAAIDAALAEQAMGANEVLSRLSDHARGDMGDFARIWTADDLAKHPLSRLVKKIERTITTTKDGDTDEKIKLELYDAQAALVHLGRYHKLFVDRQQQDDWRTEAIELIRRGEVAFDPLAEEFGRDLAIELFKAAGVAVQIGTSEAKEQAARE